jgi:hypothetical protein
MARWNILWPWEKMRFVAVRNTDDGEANTVEDIHSAAASPVSAWIDPTKMILSPALYLSFTLFMFTYGTASATTDSSTDAVAYFPTEFETVTLIE